MLIACIIIIATLFDSFHFICGSGSINVVLVALSQRVLILQKPGWGAFTSSGARLVGIDDEIDKP